MVAVAVIVPVVVTVAAILTGGLGAGRVGALSDRLAIGDIVAVSEQAIDDVGDRIAVALLPVAILLIGVWIGLLRIALLWIGLGVRVLR